MADSATPTESLVALVAFARFCKLDRVEGKGHWVGFDISLSDIDEDGPAMDVQQATSSLMLMQVAQTASLLFVCKDGFDSVRFRLCRKDGVPTAADLAPPVQAAAAAAVGPVHEAAEKRAKLALAHLRLRTAQSSPVVVAAYPSKTIDSLDGFHEWAKTGWLDPEPEQRLVRIDVDLPPDQAEALLDARALVLGQAATTVGHRCPLHSSAARDIRIAEEAGLDSLRYHKATRSASTSIALPPCGPTAMATTLGTLSRQFAAVAAVPDFDDRIRSVARAAAALLAVVSADVHEAESVGPGFVGLAACAYATFAWDGLRKGRLYRPVGVQTLGELQKEAETMDALTRSIWTPAGSSFMDTRYGSARLSRAEKRARTPKTPSSSRAGAAAASRSRSGSKPRSRSRPQKGSRPKKSRMATRRPAPASKQGQLTALERAVSAEVSGSSSGGSQRAALAGRTRLAVVVRQGQSTAAPLVMPSAHIKPEPRRITRSSRGSAGALPMASSFAGASADTDDDCIPVDEGFPVWPADSD